MTIGRGRLIATMALTRPYTGTRVRDAEAYSYLQRLRRADIKGRCVPPSLTNGRSTPAARAAGELEHMRDLGRIEPWRTPPEVPR